VNQNAQQGMLLNILVGIFRVMIGDFLLGGRSINSSTLKLTPILVSLVTWLVEASNNDRPST
jgi:uncharacterized membrane protein YeaQ/YmgE (transglycosylase-associated protein family)